MTPFRKQPSHPPDAHILKMREFEERNRWLCETVKSNLYRDCVVNWENATDEKIRRKLVKQRFDTLKAEAAAKLDCRRVRLQEKLGMEEKMYQEELGKARETPDERRAKLEARAKELREQRESERAAFADDALHRRWRENCDAVRSLDSKTIVEETQRIRAVQVDERVHRTRIEKEEEEAFDSMMEFERQKQQQQYEAGKREQRDRDNEALRVLNEQMNLQKQLKDEQEVRPSLNANRTRVSVHSLTHARTHTCRYALSLNSVTRCAPLPPLRHHYRHLVCRRSVATN